MTDAKTPGTATQRHRGGIATSSPRWGRRAPRHRGHHRAGAAVAGGAQPLARHAAHLGRALVVGITGPPGAGKSTLVNASSPTCARRANVGVIAVDPSSPVSGGAILGDRIRMTAALDDDGVFVRSLASRGYLGGLSPPPFA